MRLDKRDVVLLLVALYFIMRGISSIAYYLALEQYEIVVRIFDGVGMGMGTMIALWVYSIYRGKRDSA